MTRTAKVPVATLRSLYESGLTLREVGRKLGIDSETVRTRLERAGVPRRNPGQRLVPKMCAERAVRLYREEGLSLEEAARRSGVSPGTVANYLARAGIERRAPGPPVAPVATVERVCAMYVDDELTARDISEALGISQSTVYRRLRLGGVQPRPASHRTCWMCERVKPLKEYRKLWDRRWSRVCRECEEAER